MKKILFAVPIALISIITGSSFDPTKAEASCTRTDVVYYDDSTIVGGGLRLSNCEFTLCWGEETNVYDYSANTECNNS